MDPTLQAAIAALIGVVVGAIGVLGWHISDRVQRRPHVTEPPVVPAGVATVLSTLRSSGVVVDEHDTVLKASAPAYALGLVRGNQLVISELSDLVRQVRRDGQIRESEMTLERELAAPLTVNARVAPLGSRLVLALLEDRTRERRVEAVRRDFVANVSHELKTPVGAIKILAEAVEDAAEDPEAVRRFARRMRVESDRLTDLVQQVIELSRLQAGDIDEEQGEVRLDQVVADAVDTSALDAQSRGIQLVVGGETGLSVRGAQELVASAVTNLVANAVTYSPDHTSVVVETRSRDKVVEISVIDQGIGIAPQEIERIFERFYRVDPARHRSTGGTGLGLSIVKHVAATHGGDVKVWSVEGQGSTFTLVLPRWLANDTGTPTQASTQRPSPAPIQPPTAAPTPPADGGQQEGTTP